MAHHPGDTPEHGPAHAHGQMDIAHQEKTFDGFLRVTAILFGIVAVVLIFLAFVGT